MVVSATVGVTAPVGVGVKVNDDENKKKEKDGKGKHNSAVTGIVCVSPLKERERRKF